MLKSLHPAFRQDVRFTRVVREQYLYLCPVCDVVSDMQVCMESHRESNTIGFEHGIRWTTCVQGAPVPLGVTGAEMNERGKPEAVWPARWMAPNKNDQETTYPASTRARVPAATKKDGDGRSQRKWWGF